MAVDDITRYICLFHDAKRAHAAVNALEESGVTPGNVTTLDGGNDIQGGIDTQSNKGLSSSSLADLGVPERDMQHLQDGLQHGGVIVSLMAAESRSDEIERIFHKFSADKIDEAELQTAAPMAAPLAAPVAKEAVGDVVLPIAEESLVVGKREVERGGVRVFRRTVEEPVSESVSLHDERVVLEYRSVDRAATDADVRSGSQEFELIETAEVPVVQKTSRVVEEVRVGKVESDRTEVVEGSVRHTEVDVEPIVSEESLPGNRRN